MSTSLFALGSEGCTLERGNCFETLYDLVDISDFMDIDRGDLEPDLLRSSRLGTLAGGGGWLMEASEASSELRRSRIPSIVMKKENI